MSDHNNYNIPFNRLPFIDWLRGFSIFLMIVYHFCYDLDFFGYIDTAFGRGYWIPFRYVIVIGFLSLVGVSLVIVHSEKFAKGVRWNSIKKRSLQLLLASLAVSISSYFIAPNKITVFGILHFILIASWLALPFLSKPKLAFLLGIVVFVIGHSVSSSLFDPIYLHWIGLFENKRPALDFVGIFPWFGIVLLGIPLAYWFLDNSTGRKVAKLELSKTNTLSWLKFSYFNRLLEWMGKHSLVIYLVHQPLMFAVFYLVEIVR
ncbi:MAG: DUF1624 domain-containing protein [Gammaproteobacteria bacterium]|nr:DUF1624 domain-containing protein [Gammaproteobacteria bacterium]